MGTKYVKMPFDVELAKKITNGEAEGKVVTRDGRNARIVCWDRADKIYPIVGLCNYPDSDNEIVYSYTKDGCFDHTKKGYNQDIVLEVPEYMTFKDGDIVAFGGNNDHVGIFKSLNLKERTFSSYATLTSKSLVVYEPGWTLINIHIATKEQRQRIINALKSSEVPKAKECLKKLGIEEKPKCEFKPFDKVLVRDNDKEVWRATIFSHFENNPEHLFKFVCIGESWQYCIPYNEQTAHLLGTTENYK